MYEKTKQEQWIPLVEYAVQTGISLSTLRRHIKANKIHFKLQDGKYFLQCNALSADTLSSSLKKANEEITELKMLVSLYEEKMENKTI
ncbi:MAG: hypothetical protein HY072_08485 [Deltaproteobacteria bacterium]|nr:hypothetical protein [Deltaproteobacteria bacterium]